MNLYGCKDLINADSHLRDSGAVVRVDDFVIDPDGHISYVVLRDIPGRHEMVAVPFTLMNGDTPK